MISFIGGGVIGALFQRQIQEHLRSSSLFLLMTLIVIGLVGITLVKKRVAEKS